MEKIFYAMILIAASLASYSGLRKADYVWEDQRALGLVDTSDQPTTPSLAKSLRENWKIQNGKAFTPIPKTLWIITEAVAPDQQKVPLIMHGLSFGLHIGSSLLVMLILTLVLQSSGAAFVGSLLFALHPLQVEPVSYIAAMPFVLGTFASLFAMWQYLQYCETWGRRHLQLATMSYVAALLSVPAMAVTPLVMLLLLGILPKRSSLNSTRAPVWPLFIWVLLALAPVIWALRADATAILSTQIPLWKRPFIAGDALMFYTVKLLFPVMLGPDYGRSPNFVMSHWWGYLSWLLPFFVLLFIGYSREQLQRIYLAAFGIFCVALVPYMGFVVFSRQATSTVANSYSYLAILGPSLAVAGTVALGRRASWPAIFAGLIACFGYVSYRNVLHWQNDKSLWEHAMQITPNSPVVHSTLGNTFRREGEWEKARFHYEQVLAVNQNDPDVHFYLGEIEQQHGSAEKAAAFFERALALNPNSSDIHNRLGRAYFDQEKYEAALPHLQKATTQDPENADNYRYLGRLYTKLGQYKEAIPHLQKALSLAKDGAELHALLGLALSRTGQAQDAQKHLEAAVKLDSSDDTAHRTLGDIYYAQGSLTQARPHYEKAVRANPKDPDLNRNLGHILMSAREYEAAVNAYNRALESKPDWPEVLTSLGTAYFHLKRLTEASNTLKRSLALKANQADPHQILGDIARWQGKNAEATGEYYLALKINPEHAEANYRLGNWFLKNERRSEAIHHYKIALRTAPTDTRLISQLRKAESDAG